MNQTQKEEKKARTHRHTHIVYDFDQSENQENVYINICRQFNGNYPLANRWFRFIATQFFLLQNASSLFVIIGAADDSESKRITLSYCLVMQFHIDDSFIIVDCLYNPSNHRCEAVAIFASNWAAILSSTHFHASVDIL